jgi:hypothetical protein
MTRSLRRLTGFAAFFLLLAPSASAQQQGPAIVPRPECNPSIHEGPSGRQSAGFRQVTPLLGLLPASYDWFSGLTQALGSFFQPGAIDPQFLGEKSGQTPGYDFSGPIGLKQNVSRLYAGFKGIGGQNVTDVPQLGVAGRQCPGDPFWVGFPRPGNVEFPPPFQAIHYDWDCFCRYDEQVACPTGVPPPLGIPLFRPGPNLHRVYGGIAGFISCHQCFGSHNIRKHDYLVGTKKGPHFGYPAMAGDTGYQECLRQSIESFSGSGPGGQPSGNQIYGL